MPMRHCSPLPGRELTEALALLEQRADATARESDGTTALHWAVYHDDCRVGSAPAQGGSGSAPGE